MASLARFPAGVLSALAAVSAFSLPSPRLASADVVIPYHEYSASPTLGRGNGSSTDPEHPGYGALRFFIDEVRARTDDQGPDALPPGQQVIFQPSAGTGREISALRAGIQFANRRAALPPFFAEPSWGFIYNSLPFGLRFEQMLAFLYDAKATPEGGNGLELAQALLDRRGGTQIVLPVVGSTMQGSGYFPQPLGRPDCAPDDEECRSHGNGIGLAGLCSSDWRIRYLAPPQEILQRACTSLVKRGTIAASTLSFYPAVGGQSVLLPLQRRTIQGFEFVTPFDDLVDFFPLKDVSPAAPFGQPEAGDLDCSPPQPFPIPAGTSSNCTQNLGQTGARYAHHPAWHQPFLISWMHIDKAVWEGLNDAQRAAIRLAARNATLASYRATESVQCRKLKAMLDFNRGIGQRNIDGSPRRLAGQPEPVSAAITLARWPDDALATLRQATDDYLQELAGPAEAAQKTEAQRDFAEVIGALRKYAASIGATRFAPDNFPARSGLAVGEACRLTR